MYQFIRTVEAKNAALLPPATQFASEVTGYLNKKYALNLQCGFEMFSGAILFWTFETDSLDKISALNAKLMQDREYLALLDKVKDLWVDGSFRDRIINMLR